VSAVRLAQAGDESVFGGKAAQLATALTAGLPVPDGIAISADLVETIARTGSAPANLTDASTPVAVRSSAIGEDSAAASFAGQHATVLNVCTHAQLVDAIAEVWRSVHSEGVLAYRRRQGMLDPPRIAAVVQRLVQADVAGVAFTRDPVTGADELVVEASWGLGEAVVAGAVIPDRFRLSRDGEVLERVAGVKDLAVRPVTGGGSREESVDEQLAGRLCLDDRRLAAIRELALRSEEVFGPARDLEWAIAGDDLYLLQCRPQTAFAGVG
jgi:pyruvate,water dikinase